MLPKSIKNLIEEFSKLPGIGPKSAQRLAMHLLRSPHSKIEPLGKAVLGLKDGVVFCETCWNIADKNPCAICDDERRDRSKICVVEDVLDAAAIERTGDYNGVYHVLHGVLSPVDGVGVEELKIAELLSRVRGTGRTPEGRDGGASGTADSNDQRADGKGGGASGTADSNDQRADGKGGESHADCVKEVILATNPSLEGEATALYIQRQLAGTDVEITRIARGLPTGADIEYSDDLTLSRAMNGRGEF